ncbi:MAG: EamA family transporter [Acidimicrobiaceae bacterium]|nr:EamA family transporter [Acidimicrobiaceae bacterium]
MAALFSLAAAAFFGAGDFCGAQASKRTTVITVVAGSNVIGLVLVAALAPGMADRFDGGDFVAGMLGGLSGLVGITLLYRCLSTGPMAVVAPVAAVTNAAVPVLWGVNFGEQLTGLHLVGVAVGLVAIVLVSRPPEAAKPVTARLLAESTLAGIGFAGFFIVLDGTDHAAAPWPLVGGRLLTVLVLLVVLAVAPKARGGVRGAGRLILVCGLCDGGANVVMLEALGRGMLSLAAVLTSLYPAVTVILARTILGEPISRGQVIGLVGALGAISLIVGG